MYMPFILARSNELAEFTEEPDRVGNLASLFSGSEPGREASQDLKRGVLKEEAATYTRRNDMSDKSFSSRDRKAN
jgi:hypothetical protein